MTSEQWKTRGWTEKTQWAHALAEERAALQRVRLKVTTAQAVADAARPTGDSASSSEDGAEKNITATESDPERLVEEAAVQAQLCERQAVAKQRVASQLSNLCKQSPLQVFVAAWELATPYAAWQQQKSSIDREKMRRKRQAALCRRVSSSLSQQPMRPQSARVVCVNV